MCLCSGIPRPLTREQILKWFSSHPYSCCRIWAWEYLRKNEKVMRMPARTVMMEQPMAMSSIV